MLNIKLHEIMCISSRATLAIKFLSHTDIFQKLSNRVQVTLKRVNLSRTGSRKFLENQYYLEEKK